MLEHGRTCLRLIHPDIAWLRPYGNPMQDDDWNHYRAFTMLLASASDARLAALAVLLNGADDPHAFSLERYRPDSPWSAVFSSDPGVTQGGTAWRVAGQSVVCLTAD